MEFPNFKKTRLSQLVARGLIISGRGGSKSSGSSRTPVEANDTVNSRAMASVLDLLGEGVVGGLVDGAKSIFLNDTPLQNDDGSTNFSGVTWWFRDGSQDQSVIDGFDFIETPKSVSRQLTKTSQINVTLDSADSDRVRVVMKFPSLRTIDKSSGDTNAATVQFKFQIDAGNGAGFVDVTPEGESQSTVTLTAKKTGVYYRSYVIDLPKPDKAYTLRAIRLTDDHADNSYLYDDTYVDSIGEIVNTSLNYPNSVLVGLKINSEQFGSSMPTRSYLIKGLKIRVPANYDESTNTYNGNWDGTFKLVSSSNPAWILFDLLTNTRYGLGEFVQESMINLGELYQIGRYCDATVDDGFGGKEKRFSINTQITSRQDAYRVVQDIAGAFRGMVYWAGGMVHVTQDSPADPVMLFSNSNVVNGAFAYKGSARKDRFSVALITYNNKDDGYKQSVEYVEDQEAIKRYGIRKTESVAFGCTSRGQAHRVGLWTLYTSRMESDVITFAVGMDSIFLMPGDVILLADKYRAGRRNSGRVIAHTANSITLDVPVDLTTVGNHITFLSSEGVMVERDILENGKAISTVTFKSALSSSETPVADSVWVIAQPDLAPMQARVVSVTEGTDGVSFNITAIQNNPTKYEAIDSGAELIPQSTTVLDPTYSKPSNLTITEGTYLSSPGNLSVSLTAAWQGKSSQYYVSWRRSDAGNISNWQSQRVTEEQFELKGVDENGQYDFQVYAVSVSGRKTDPLSITYKVLGTLSAPDAPTTLTAAGDYRSIVLNWSNPSSVDLDHIEVLGSKTNDSGTAQLIAKVSGTSFTHSGLEDSVTWYYWVRAANKRGMLSRLNSNLGTSGTTKDVLSFLKNKITQSELGKTLLSDIDSKADSAAVDNAINDANEQATAQVKQARTDATTALNNAKSSLTTALNQETADRSAAINAEAATRGKAIADEAASRAAAITDSAAVEASNRTKAINDATTALTAKITKETTDRAAAVAALDAKTATAVSQEAQSRLDAVSKEASARADAVLQEQNDRKAQIQTVTTQMQSGQDSLAQQIAKVAAGTGEQFDSLNIWYFDDKSTDGWAGNGGTPPVSADGWMRPPVSGDAFVTSPALSFSATAYRFVKMRIRKVGSPSWNGELRWISGNVGYNDTNMTVLPEPVWDAEGIATITAQDIPWTAANTITGIRLDMVRAVDAKNYVEFDWIAVGRPTPGAGMAALQDEQAARVKADAAEAANRNTLAVQMRGSYEGNDLAQVGSGLIYQEQQARVTADKAEASARQTLETKVNDSVSSFNQSIDTLNTKDQAMASDISGLKTSLGNKADASALQSLSSNVSQQGSTLSTQGQSITKLQNDLNTTNTNVGKKADQTAVTALQGTVTQQGKDITAANSNITNLQSSLSKTDANVNKKADASAVNDLTSRVSSAENNISSQGNSIVTLSNNLSQTGSKGTNAWFDGSLETFNVNDQIGGSGAVVSSAQKYSGSKSLLVRRAANETGNSDKVLGPLMAVRQSAVYRIEAWVYMGSDQSPSSNWSVVIGMNTVAQSGGLAWTGAFNVTESSLGARNKWVKFIGTLTTPGDCVTGRMWVSTRGNMGNNTPGYDAYLDNIVVTEITDATAAQKTADTNASAISSLQNTVTQQGKDLTSQSASVTDLKNSIDSTNAAVAKKADSSALSSLQSTVTKQGNDITSANNSITSLKSGLTDANNNTNTKVGAVSDAVQSLQGTVKQQGDSISSQGDSITSLSNNITGILQKGAAININPLMNTDEGWHMAYGAVWSATGGDGKPGIVLTKNGSSNPELYPNDGQWNMVSGARRYRIIVRGKSLSGAGNLLVRRHYKDSPQGADKTDETTIIFPSDGFANRTVDFVATSDTTAMVYFQTYCYPQNATVAIDSMAVYDITDALTSAANTSAISSLQSTVKQQGDSLTSQSGSITSLQNSLAQTNKSVAAKADSTALASLQSTVTQQGTDITSQGNDIDALQAHLTTGANILPNPSFLGNGSGWSYSATGTDGDRNYLEGNWQYAPNSPSFDVNPGDDILVGCDLWLSVTDAIVFRVRFDGPDMYNNAYGVFSLNMTANTWASGSGVTTVPEGATTCSLQAVHGNGNARIANPYVFVKSASASALQSLSNTVAQQGNTLSSQGSAITSLQNSLNTTNSNVSKKADATALQTLANTVSQQASSLSTQSNAITSLQNTLTATSVGGVNLIPLSGTMDNYPNRSSETYRGNAVISATTKAGQGYVDLNEIQLSAPIDGTDYVYSFWAKAAVDGQMVSAFFYNPNTTLQAVTNQGSTSTAGDGRIQFKLTTSWARYWVKWKQTAGTGTKRLVLCRLESASVAQTVSLSSPKLEIGNTVTDWSPAPGDMATDNDLNALASKVTANSTAIQSVTSRVSSVEGTVTSQGAAVTALQNGLSSTNSTVAQKADASALTSLQNTVTQQGKDLTLAGTNVTALQASLNRRTAFTLASTGLGSTGVQGGVFAESGTQLVGLGRSYTLVTFKKNTDGSTAVASSKSYDVYTNGSNATTLSADIKALANGVYAAILTNDEPQRNVASLYTAIESLGGTSEMLSTIQYRGAYILVGRKGMKPGDGLELVSPSGGVADSLITTSAEFVNGILMGLGAAGGVMIKADANASAISTLNNTVTQQGKDISSASSAVTSLQNDLKTTNGNVSNKADSSALDALKSTVTSQGATITSQGTRVTTLENNLTLGDNIVPNSAMLNNAQGWGGSATTVDGYPAVFSAVSWAPTSPKFNVTPGDIIDFTLMCMSAAAINGLGWGIRFDGPSLSNSTAYIGGANYAAGEKKSVSGTITVPAGATTGMLQPSVSNAIGFTIYNVDVTRRNAGTLANSSAISTLNNTVTQQGKDIASASTAITNLQNSLNTANSNISKKADSSALTTLTSKVNAQGDDLTSTQSRTDALEASVTSGENLVPNPMMLNNAKGWGSAVKGVTKVDNQPAALCYGAWQAYSNSFPVTPGETIYWSFDIQALEDLKGKDFSIYYIDQSGAISGTNNWFYYKDLAKGARDHISVSYVVPAGMSRAYLNGGKIDGQFYLWNVVASRQSAADLANASAISTLSNTVTQQGKDISSASSAITSLQNGLSTANTNISKKADATALSSLQNTVTQQGKDISSTSSSITTLSNNVNQALKQGANLVTDSSFEYSSPSGNLSVTADDHHTGSKCGRVKRNAATNSGGNNDLQYGPWFDLRDNQVFYVEIWAKLDPNNTVSSPDGWANVGVQWQNSAAANNWPSAFQIHFKDLTSSWKKFTGYVGVGTDAARAIFWMSVPQSASNIQGYSFLIDDIVVMDVTDGYNAQKTADAATSAVNSLSTKVTDIGDKVTAQTTQLSSMQSKVDSANSQVDQLAKTISDNQSTQASLNTSLQSQISSQASANIKNQATIDAATTSIASIKSTQSTQANQISAVAQAQTNMTASLNNQSATIQTLQQTVASNSALNSTWMVKMQTNSNGQKYAAGIALGVDGTNMQSQFLVQADRFALINTGNNNTTTPFVIDSGTTYINSAFIKNGSIDSAKVGDLMSNGFVENVSGWRISRDGTMNINGSSGGSGRMVISNNRLEVYDNNNRLRVRLGLF